MHNANPTKKEFCKAKVRYGHHTPKKGNYRGHRQ